MEKSMSFRIGKCLSINKLLSKVIHWDVLMGDFPLSSPQVSSSVGLLIVLERAPHQFSPVASLPGASCEEGCVSDLTPLKLKSCPAPQTAPPPVSSSKVMTSTWVLFLKVLVSFLLLLSLPRSTPERLGSAVGSTFAAGQSPVPSQRSRHHLLPFRSEPQVPLLQFCNLCGLYASPPAPGPIPLLHSQPSPPTGRSDAFKAEVRACQFLLKIPQ